MDTPDAELDVIGLSASATSDAVSPSTDALLDPAVALERLKQGKPIENARIVRLKLKGDFPLPVRFRNVTLVQPVIDQATFADEVAFEHCTLDRWKIARHATFAKGLNLSASTLVRANLYRLTVTGTFRCDNVRTRGRFLIDGAKFLGTVRFWGAQFQDWVEFKGCEFAGDADFRSFHADQGFIADKCTFRATALFRGATVSKKWQADGTRFEGLLDLSKAKLHDFVYLRGDRAGTRDALRLHQHARRADPRRAEQLHGRIASEEAGEHAQAMQEYGLLKRIFEGLHRYEHEDWAFYRFKVNQRRCKARSWRKPWSKLAHFADWLLLDLGCGYGTNPFRASAPRW